jgi:NAD-dependent dihydropyrimidine dehydrogenase PreA subunit
MTYVITQPCIGVKDASCVDVCPVDCIHATEDDEQFFIDPDECIDCGACEPVCPVNAIFEEERSQKVEAVYPTERRVFRQPAQQEKEKIRAGAARGYSRSPCPYVSRCSMRSGWPLPGRR